MPEKAGKLSDRAEGCCAACCEKYCRCSPWTQCLCWVMTALVLATIALWLGGAFLVGPARSHHAQGSQCGANLTIPLINQDAYIWYLSSSGIIVLVMVLTSCICCSSFAGLCSEGLPRAIRIVSAIGVIIVFLVLAVYLGWLAMGTYFVLKLHSWDALCRNTVIYVVLLYVYLLILVVVGVVMCLWSVRKAAAAGTSKKKKRTGKT